MTNVARPDLLIQMHNLLSDEEIINQVLTGDGNAFSEIVKRWDRKIFALCFGMLGREDEANDAVQETFISAYKALNKFRGDAKISSWLHRIAVNQCLSIKRKKNSLSEDYIDPDDGAEDRIFVAEEFQSPAKITERNERSLAVRNALNSLPEDLRQVIVMKEFEGLKFHEIAEILELPLSTVKSRLYNGLKQMRIKLTSLKLEVI